MLCCTVCLQIKTQARQSKLTLAGQNCLKPYAFAITKLPVLTTDPSVGAWHPLCIWQVCTGWPVGVWRGIGGPCCASRENCCPNDDPCCSKGVLCCAMMGLWGGKSGACCPKEIPCSNRMCFWKAKAGLSGCEHDHNIPELACELMYAYETKPLLKHNTYKICQC